MELSYVSPHMVNALSTLSAILPSPRHEWSSLLSAPCSVLGWDIGTSRPRDPDMIWRKSGAWRWSVARNTTGINRYHRLHSTMKLHRLHMIWSDMNTLQCQIYSNMTGFYPPEINQWSSPVFPDIFHLHLRRFPSHSRKSGSLAWSVPVSCHSLRHLAAKHQKNVACLVSVYDC